MGLYVSPHFISKKVHLDISRCIVMYCSFHSDVDTQIIIVNVLIGLLRKPNVAVCLPQRCLLKFIPDAPVTSCTCMELSVTMQRATCVCCRYLGCYSACWCLLFVSVCVGGAQAPVRACVCVGI